MLVRELKAEDADDWLRLWAGYNAFYETLVPSEVTEHALRRLLDPGSNLFGRVAEKDGRVVGFSTCVLHESTWTMSLCCYLEDLFVDPHYRGGGVGRALLRDLIELGRARGWARLYWHTRVDNARARKLYDDFVVADDFVRYRLALK